VKVFLLIGSDIRGFLSTLSKHAVFFLFIEILVLYGEHTCDPMS
jgi:hypothetical protein